MPGKRVEFVVFRPSGGKDRRVARSDLPTAFPLECLTDDCCTGRSSAVGYEAVDELDQLFG